jgi:hypothetical protein
MSRNVKTAHRVAIVWRGHEDAPDARQPETGRLKAIFAALTRSGYRPEPAPYDERHSDKFAKRLHSVNAVLVWVNPIDSGRNRKALDNILRETASAGVFVSAHPDVIAKMGVKAVLHRTRTLGWGSDTHYYETPAAFAAEFPASRRSSVKNGHGRFVPKEWSFVTRVRDGTAARRNLLSRNAN